jgi:hypothetical protein
MEYGPANYTILIKIALIAETGSAMGNLSPSLLVNF